MEELTLRAHAKINLFLRITGKRPDGYHTLETVMKSLSLADTLTFRKTAGRDFSILSGGVLPDDEKNLVRRAANAFFAASGKPFGFVATLKKEIPMAAGLGGGSADAAATLTALNALSDAPLSPDTLLEIAARVGADVPFCLLCGTRLCTGVGEITSPLVDRTRAAFVIAVKGEGVSTPRAFAAWDAAAKKREAPSCAALTAALASGDLAALAGALYNELEAIVEPLRPAIGELKRDLLVAGALAARMSGSGPSVYGLFADEESARRAAYSLTEKGARAFVALSFAP